MIINNTDKYEELAAEWQYQMLKLLKVKLILNQVPLETAKEICGDFAFDLAMLQDQGRINVNEAKYRPVICFDDSKEQLHFNSAKQFQLHEYAYGKNSELFENE